MNEDDSPTWPRLGQVVDIPPIPGGKGVVTALSTGADGSVRMKIQHTQWVEVTRPEAG